MEGGREGGRDGGREGRREGGRDECACECESMHLCVHAHVCTCTCTRVCVCMCETVCACMCETVCACMCETVCACVCDQLTEQRRASETLQSREDRSRRFYLHIHVPLILQPSFLFHWRWFVLYEMPFEKLLLLAVSASVVLHGVPCS